MWYMCWGTHSLWVTALPWVSRQLLNSAGIHGASAGPLLPHPASCLWGQRLSHSRTGSPSGVPVKWNKSLDKHWDSPRWEHRDEIVNMEGKLQSRLSKDLSGRLALNSTVDLSSRAQFAFGRLQLHCLIRRTSSVLEKTKTILCFTP